MTVPCLSSHAKLSHRSPPRACLVQVGRERCYTPTPEDVGAILKFDCTAYDAASPYPEMGKTFSIITARVRPGGARGRKREMYWRASSFALMSTCFDEEVEREGIAGVFRNDCLNADPRIHFCGLLAWPFSSLS